MKFFIKQNSTLPELIYPLEDSLLKKYNITTTMLENVAITFSMISEDNNIYRIANKNASLIVYENNNEHSDDQTYALSYKFSLKDTSKQGKFTGEFIIDFLDKNNCGKIGFPVDNEKIEILISESITKTQTTKELGDNLPTSLNPKLIQFYSASELEQDLTDEQKYDLLELLLQQTAWITAKETI